MKTAYTHDELVQNYGEPSVLEALKTLEIPKQDSYDTNKEEVVVLLQELASHKKNSQKGQGFSEWSKSKPTRQPIAQPETQQPLAGQEQASPPEFEVLSPDIAAATQELGGVSSAIDPKRLALLNEQAFREAVSERVVVTALKGRHLATDAVRRHPAVLAVEQMVHGSYLAPHEGMTEGVIEVREELSNRLPPSKSFLSNIFPPRPSQPGEENGTGLKRLAGNK